MQNEEKQGVEHRGKSTRSRSHTTGCSGTAWKPWTQPELSFDCELLTQPGPAENETELECLTRSDRTAQNRSDSEKEWDSVQNTCN